MKVKYKRPLIVYSQTPSDQNRHEDDSALSTVNAFFENLNDFQVETFCFPCPYSPKDLFSFFEFIKEKEIDYIFNFCEELDGDSSFEGDLASLFKLLNLSFSGNTPDVLHFCRDKFKVSSLLEASEVRVPFNYPVFSKRDLMAVEKKVIIKPMCEDGSFGLSKNSVCRSFDELVIAYNDVRKEMSGPLMVEEYVDGREINASILGEDVFALSEVTFNYKDNSYPNILTYESKWEVGSDVYDRSKVVCPAKIAKNIEHEICMIAKKVFQLLSLRHYARVDFRLDEKGLPYVIDVNPNPCIAPDSGFINALKTKGEYYKKIIEIFFSI